MKKLIVRASFIFVLAVGLSACGEISEEEKNQELDPVNVIDASNLNDIMLNFADPNEAVRYFRRAMDQEPDRVEFKFGYARALLRARRFADAVLVYEQLDADGLLENRDRVDYADALIRNAGWDRAEAQLDKIPPSYETYDRYFLEALVADHNREWRKADSFYDIALGLTTSDALVLNNWGISKQTRGDLSSAEELFRKAIAADSKLFTAKSNLVSVRARRGVYELPIIPMTDTERALLLYEMAIVAIRNGDNDIAIPLLEAAIEIHPQHFPSAVEKLRVLQSGGSI